MFKQVDTKQNFPEMEKNVLEFWKKNKVFKESAKENNERSVFSFFDGPPFATGLPHYGHVVASLIKDVVPRFWTMKGNQVERRWGWDCHGLPVENLIEKELGINNKQEIEAMGVGCFNDACKNSVLRYADDWKEFIPKIGRWVDMNNDYKTMNAEYTESIWWVFSEIYKKGLVYESYKSMHLCPRCETTLSNFEVTQGYKDITDLSATVKFKLTKESVEKLNEKILKQVQDNNAEMQHTPYPSQEGNNSVDVSQKRGGMAGDVYVLAWTTTPWTLPGNVALAVGSDVNYVEIVERVRADIGSDVYTYELPSGERYIIAKEVFLKEGQKLVPNNDLSQVYIYSRKNYEIVKEFKGSDLVGLSYEPLFPYYAKQEDLENRENGWKIYAGDFVTTEEGTGIVHIAPAFGDDDMNLAREKNLPFVQHVKTSGRFVGLVDELSEEDKHFFVDKDGLGREVKPKRNSRETDEKVVEYLEKNGDLFAKENYKHSYPHCWRCDTPLLNYAASSWFVEVTKIKDKLIANNQEVNWVPGYIKDGRFGKWLEDARDWAISRSRFWGAPLPIWRCEDCEEIEVVGSIDEMREKTDKKITKFIFVRHGFAENNVTGVRSSGDNEHHLTEIGRSQSEITAEKLKGEKIDMIISSPVLRARETAEIISASLGNVSIAKEEMLREYNFGSWNGFTSEQLLTDNELYRSYRAMPNSEERYKFKLGGDGESRFDIESRIREFIKTYSEKYPGKNILVVSHGGIGAMFYRILRGVNEKDFFPLEFRIDNAKDIAFYVDETGKGLDLHKPYIDGIELQCPKCQKKMKIVGDVFDCWFESGSMPYAQVHYPFENREKFAKSFPADFIAEGVDQTRGWFYTLMVLSTALFDKPAFKNVIVNGIVLAEDGQKMSKKLKNYPDPNELLNKYGADALRYYLLTSPVMKAENLRFSEKGVDEVLKKFILTLWNTYSFLVMNIELNKVEEKDIVDFAKSQNILDKWILSELNLLIAEVDTEMANYDLVKASRPLKDFVDKLSNWYLRRSRRRFASEDILDRNSAYQTLYFVLVTFSKVMAPFMPFLSEEIFKNLTDEKSVHLEGFPKPSGNVDNAILEQMNLVREVVTLGLAARASGKMKVRMPLSMIEIQNTGILKLEEDYIEIIKEELNVKEVALVKEIGERSNFSFAEGSGIKVALDLTLTEELELEGLSREFIRQIQSMRKEAKYNRDSVIVVKYKIVLGNKLAKMIEKWMAEIRLECLAKELAVSENPQENSDIFSDFEVGEEKLSLGIELYK
jgi:isoleucyl-tRNA synthetase